MLKAVFKSMDLWLRYVSHPTKSQSEKKKSKKTLINIPEAKKISKIITRKNVPSLYSWYMFALQSERGNIDI